MEQAIYFAMGTLSLLALIIGIGSAVEEYEDIRRLKDNG